MNSLLSYGSDDDCDDSSDEKQPDWRAGVPKERAKGGQVDANYEEVQMDLSEESNESKPETKEKDAPSTTSSSSSRRSREKDKERRERDRERTRRDRDRKYRRSPSRERERDRERRRSSRSPRRSRRSRSRSRDRDRRYTNRRYEKNPSYKGPDKIEVPKNPVEERDKPQAAPEGNRFFMPGITGRFREQIERRKQLWQKKEPAEQDNANKQNGQSKKVWETTTFAQDTDGKVANKFKRLMGIKNNTSGTSGGTTDVLKKQEEMFSSMEQQYEVARTATHTMRGVGLGFGSFQR